MSPSQVGGSENTHAASPLSALPMTSLDHRPQLRQLLSLVQENVLRADRAAALAQLGYWTTMLKAYDWPGMDALFFDVHELIDCLHGDTPDAECVRELLLRMGQRTLRVAEAVLDPETEELLRRTGRLLAVSGGRMR